MNDNEKTVTEYTFSLMERDCIDIEGFPLEKWSEHKVVFESGTRWCSVLYEFAKFLSMHYGYDIVGKIEVEGEKLANSIYSYEQQASILDSLCQAEGDFPEDDLPEFIFDPEETEDSDFLSKPIKTKKSKKKNKKIKNFFMGSADDWADVE